MSTIRVDRISPYQAGSVTIDGNVIQANAATTGSNTFVGDQNIEGTITASIAEGFALVGGVGSVSTLVATSSFGGGGSSDITALNSFTASQEDLNGTFAITGSNSFVGNQNITGSLSVSGAITGSQVGNIIPFYFANRAAFPSASTYHGAIAHSHSDGKMYYAHGGNWIELANTTGSFSGSFVGDGSGLTGILGVTPIATGSFATTGSNTFVGSQTIGGNVFADNYKGYNSLVGTPSSEVITFNVLSVTKTSNHRYFGTGSAIGYHIDGVEAPFLTLLPGKTYRFNQEASNNTHQLRFYYQADRTTPYTTNVTHNGTAGQAGAYTQIVVTDTTPTVLHYQCVNHGYMGNSAQFNSNVIDTPYLINAKSGITVTGTVTATTFTGLFVGDGSGLTNIPGVSGSVLATGSFATTGSNTFVGNQIISGSTTISGSISQVGIGDRNTIIGDGAGVANTVGSGGGGDYNTFIGVGAAASNISGRGNTILGPNALGGNVQGDSNIAIGTEAGTYSEGFQPNSTVNESIFIGNGTESKLSNQTNQIVIGNFTVGNGNNTVTIGNNNIVSTHLKGTVFATTFTGSFVGDGSGLTGISIANGSFATTGSNIFNGNQIITGSLNINGSINATSAVTALAFLGDASYAVSGRWVIGAIGTSDYTFTGIGFLSTTNDPVLYLARGRVYEFVITSGGSHPFQIRLNNGQAYNNGVTNNGASSGVIRFEIPFNAPNTLYYQCTNHSGMGNTINVYPSI